MKLKVNNLNTNPGKNGNINETWTTKPEKKNISTLTYTKELEHIKSARNASQ